VLLHEFF